jgi:predicted alpha/beta-fold hydrolase
MAQVRTRQRYRRSSTWAARRARTFARYDRVVTAPLNGFADEAGLQRRAWRSPYLVRVRPTLLIGAATIPSPAETLPDTSSCRRI